MLAILSVATILATLLCTSNGFYLDLFTYSLEPSSNETEAREFLSKYNEEVQKLMTESTITEWKYYTNLTDENEKINSAASLKVYSRFTKHSSFVNLNRKILLNSQSVSYNNIKQFDYQLAEFNTAAYLTASKFDTTNFKDDTKRQLKKVCIQSKAHQIRYY